MKKSELLFVIVVTVTMMSTFVYAVTRFPKVKEVKYHAKRSYSFDIVDDSIYVYNKHDELVGGVKIEGQLDSLIIEDNR